MTSQSIDQHLEDMELDSPGQESSNRYAKLMGVGVGLSLIFDVVLAAGIILENREATIGGAAGTAAGIGAMAVGAVLHHKHSQ